MMMSYNLIYNLVPILIHTYVLYTLFILLCIIQSWKYIRIYYYLSKIPGPRGWPIIGYLSLLKHFKNGELYFEKMGQIGDFFRAWIGPLPFVGICDAEVLQTLFSTTNSLDRGWIFRLFLRGIFKDSIVIANVEKWKHTRKICNYGFSQTILNSFLPIFDTVSIKINEQLKNEIGNTFNIHTYIRRAVFDSICGSAMGIDINNSKLIDTSYAKAVDLAIETLVKRAKTIWMYPQFIFNMTELGRQQTNYLKICLETTNKVFDEKLKSTSNYEQRVKNEYHNIDEPIEKNPLKKPFLDFLLDMVYTHSEFTIDQLKDEISAIILAAYETTPTTLSYFFVMVGARKDIQEKIYNEIYSIFKNSNRPFQLEDFSKLKYLEMVIKETLRLFPAVAHTIRYASKDIDIGNYIIPEGTHIYISFMRILRNEKYWKNPLEFNPERFLTNQQHPYAYVPFGKGPRNCIGAKYAMMLMKLLATSILRKYEIHTNLKLNELEFKIDVSLKLIGGYLISIKER